jgi:hypothetical protein
MRSKVQIRPDYGSNAGRGFRAAERLPLPAAVLLAFCLIYGVGCSSGVNASSKSESPQAPVKTANKPVAEPRSAESKSVDPAVQSEVQKMDSEKRLTLLKDAQSALEETHNALQALDKGDKNTALAALERVTGKLDLVVARDSKLAFAPVNVSTTILDLYATPDTVKGAVKDAKDYLSNNRVQDARLLVENLASEADIHVTEIPLATYPAAIRAVAPLIDSGKIDEAKAALSTALNTLVVETFVIPLPKIRAVAMLGDADNLTKSSTLKEEDKTKVRNLIDATRHELQLAEALGYGTAANYKPLYAQLDEIQKKTEGGQTGKGMFDKFRKSLKAFKFSV